MDLNLIQDRYNSLTLSSQVRTTVIIIVCGEIHIHFSAFQRLYLGGGYHRRVAGKVWLNAQLLFNVLQNERSPNRRWEPVSSVGVAAGF
jgi:hypothetical protein